MNKKILFSIPFYGETEEEYFNKMLIERKKRLPNVPEEERRLLYPQFFPNDYVWKNRILGYIDVVYCNGEIFYILYNMYSEKYLNKNDLTECIDKLKLQNLSEEDRRMKENAYGGPQSFIQYKMPYYTTKKHYMSETRVQGLKFFVTKEMTNLDIANEIKEDIEIIIKNELKGLYIDLNQFLNLFDVIDYSKVFSKENNSNG